MVLQQERRFRVARRYREKTKAQWKADIVAVAATFAKMSATLAAIGGTPRARLLWLGDVLRRDLTGDVARETTADEMNAFLVTYYRAWGGDFTTAADIQQLIEADTVPAIQAALRDVLDRLVPDESVWLSQPIGDGLVWRPRKGVLLVTRAAGLPQVLSAVVDLLNSIGPRLRRCGTPTCRRLFAVNRPGQIRCVPSCGSTLRVQEWRRKNRERLSEAKHRQYARKVAARLPGARVTRRKQKGS